MIGVGRGYVIALLLLTAVVFVAACSDEAPTPTANSGSDDAAGREPTVEVLAPTPSPTPTATPTVLEKAQDQCNRAANIMPLPESSSETESTPDPLQLLQESAVSMSKLESFAITRIDLQTIEERSEKYPYERGSNCRVREIEYENPGRMTSMQIRYEEEKLPDMSQEEDIRIGENRYSREYDRELWRPRDGGYVPSSDSLLPFVMWFLLNKETPEGIESELKLLGTEILDGVAVYHVNEEVTTSNLAFKNVASFWIGVDDLLLRRSHWEYHEIINYHDGRLGLTSELLDFHSFNEDFDIRPPSENQIEPSE